MNNDEIIKAIRRFCVLFGSFFVYFGKIREA